MTTNNEAFDKWCKGMCIKPLTPQEESNLSWAKSAMNYGIKSATTEANKRIAELESEIELQSSLNKKLYLSFLELQASNNRLRESLETVENNWKKTGWGYNEVIREKVKKALSATPSHSLADYDNELIERCAVRGRLAQLESKVVDIEIRALKS